MNYNVFDKSAFKLQSLKEIKGYVSKVKMQYFDEALMIIKTPKTLSMLPLSVHSSLIECSL